MRHAPAAALALSLLLIAAAPAARAQAEACDDPADFPCGYQLEAHALAPAPALLKLQARVAQGGLPIGQASFPKLSVKVLSGAQTLCVEKFEDVQIQGSVFNLVLGREMSCELDAVIAHHGNLALEICPGLPKGCLPAMPLRSSPYAVRVTWTWLAQRAHRADRAAQAHYAHRFTADGDLDDTGVLGAGYFDAETPSAEAAAPLYPTAESFAPYADGGYLLWTPLRDREARSVHLAAKTHDGDTLGALDRVALHARTTRTTGDLTVDGDAAGGPGLTVAGRGAHVTGDSTVSGDLDAGGPLTVDGTWEQPAGAAFAAQLTVGAGLEITPWALEVTGGSEVVGPLSAAQAVTASAGASVGGDSTVTGHLEVTAAAAPAAQVTGGLEGLGLATADTAAITGDATTEVALLAAALEVTGGGAAEDVDVAGALAALGSVVFSGPVSFLGGTSNPNDTADMTYVQYEGEGRDLTFGGAMSFAGGVAAAADVDLGLHALAGARLELAEAPPGECDEAALGRIYLDMSDQTVRQCVAGLWKVMGGGSGEAASLCGNGYLQGDEGCDDGNLAPGDGCTPECAVEAGWTCAPGGCAPTCGDAVQVGDETCDDGDDQPGDGCSASCAIEPGWSCEGTPSVCGVPCGDGVVAGAEGCDDGALEPGDGCDPGCQVEPGWYCAGGDPSVCAPVPLAVPGYEGVAGPDLTLEGLSLCAGAGPGDEGVSGTEWLLPCEGYSAITFACSTADDLEPELVSPNLPLDGVLLTDDACDEWPGAAITPLFGDLVLGVDAAADPGCGQGSTTWDMYVHFGTLWACVGTDITPGYVGQTGGRIWAYVRYP